MPRHLARQSRRPRGTRQKDQNKNACCTRNPTMRCNRLERITAGRVQPRTEVQSERNDCPQSAPRSDTHTWCLQHKAKQTTNGHTSTAQAIGLDKTSQDNKRFSTEICIYIRYAKICPTAPRRYHWNGGRCSRAGTCSRGGRRATKSPAGPEQQQSLSCQVLSQTRKSNPPYIKGAPR